MTNHLPARILAILAAGALTSCGQRSSITLIDNPTPPDSSINIAPLSLPKNTSNVIVVNPSELEQIIDDYGPRNLKDWEFCGSETMDKSFVDLKPIKQAGTFYVYKKMHEPEIFDKKAEIRLYIVDRDAKHGGSVWSFPAELSDAKIKDAIEQIQWLKKNYHDKPTTPKPKAHWQFKIESPFFKKNTPPFIG